MTVHLAQDQLLDYLLEEGQPDEMEHIAAHLDVCLACRSKWLRFCQESRKVEDLIDSANAAEFGRILRELRTASGLTKSLTSPSSSASPDDSGFKWDDHFWHWIADYEKKAPALEVKKPNLEEKQPPKTEPPRSSRKANRILLLVSAFCIMAVLLLIAIAEIGQFWLPSEVATLKSSIQASWSDSTVPESGSRLTRRGELLHLEHGMVEVVFDSGAEAVIEGPAQFRLKSANRIELQSGRVFAEVPPSARGFTVDTPQASIVDLGTQFGVKVESGISSGLHLFKGKALLTPSGATGSGKSEILMAGQAGSVNTAGQITRIPVNDTAFVRRLFPKSGFIWRGQAIDLGDVVGGGNGFGTGQLNRWLGIGTGMDGTRFIVNGQPALYNQTTDNRYHRVTHLPYVDGVFSPDANTGPVQVSSQGHIWRDCPRTSGTFFEDIFNGNYISFGTDSHGFVLGGQAYGTREHSAIALHSNAGITFDLDAMRRDMPGLEIIRFTARCGISEDVRTHLDGTPRRALADFWVLVDGQKRFEAKGMNVDSPPGEISVPLSSQERFVTLVTTDGNGWANYDWGFFAEPQLEVQAVP
jgi:hypothetical protein